MSIKRDLSNLLAISLGDGYINKNGYISVRHMLAQQEYLEWKYSLIKKFCDITPYYVDNNGYGAFEFRTRCSKYVRFLRRILYQEGYKRITPKLLRKVGLLGLAILYLDDGSLCAKKRNGKIHAYDLIISLYISEEECEDLVEYIKKEYSLTFTIKRNKGKCSIRCGTGEARKFLKMIRPLIPNFECFNDSKLKSI